MTVSAGPVVFSVRVNGAVSLDTPSDFELRQSWGNHDMFFLRMIVPAALPNKNQLTAWADGAAVEIVWGRQPESVSTWYGYINHHENSTKEDTGLNVNQITYVCIGTSKVLNGHVNKTWKNMTAAGMAQTIAQANGFRAVVTKSSWMLNETQANESDFQFLNRIADKVGFRFWVSGGTLYLIDPMVLLSASSMYFLPHYQLNNQISNIDYAQNFKVVQGDNFPGSVQMNRTVYGLDPSTGQVFATTATGDSYANTTVDTSRYVTSQGEALNIANAKKALSQFWIQATIEVMGLGVLYPGKVINITGAALTDTTSGDWIVTGADHVLKTVGKMPSDDKYVTRLSLIRSAKDTSLIPYIKSVQKVVPEFVTCRLQATKQWVATQMATITEGVE